MNIKGIIYHLGINVFPCRYWPKWLHKLKLNKTNKKYFGKTVDFKKPITFNEKIQWYMVNCNDERVTKFTDKLSFKEYIRTIIGPGYTAELLEAWDKPEDVDFSRLKAPFVLKSNCSGDGKNIIIVTGKNYDSNELKDEVLKWFNWRNTFINSSSKAYHRIKPKVFAEEYLPAPDGNLIDYKFYCFNGNPYCAYSSFGGFDYEGNAKFGFYNSKWEPINIQYGDREMASVPPPVHLKEMIDIASKLSDGLPFVRVDFYDFPERVVVGEMTYDSSFGMKHFEPESFDYELGALFDLSLCR